MQIDRATLALFLTLGFLAAPALHAQVPGSAELRLNRTMTGLQTAPAVATAAGRGFVAAWQSSSGAHSPASDVRLRLFNAAGAARTGELQVTRAEAGSQRRPAVAMAADGHFAVVWEATTGTGQTLVFGRLFSAGGQPIGQRFPLAASSQRQQYQPAVAMTADGRFVAVWAQEDGGFIDGATFDVYARRFAADGTPQGEEFPAIAFFDDQSEPRVAVAADGGFVVVCQSFVAATQPNATALDVFARVFAADGTPAADAFPVNANPTAAGTSAFEPAVARTPDGRFAVAWTATDDPAGIGFADSYGVRLRLFTAGGAPLGPVIPVNVFVRGMQRSPAVAATGDGTLLVAWQSGANQDGDREGIFARVAGFDGHLRGREFRINLGRAGSQILPAVVLTPDGGRGMAVWETPGGIDARLLVPAR